MDARAITAVIVAAIVVAVLIAIAVWVYRRRRTERLRAQFGPEYDRVLAERGSRRRAEDELEARVKRVRALPLRDLDASERGRFADAWRAAQARFVDDPPGAVAQADRLIVETMQARGYPKGGFEQCAADLSVTHSRVMGSYWAAHAVAARAGTEGSTTEDLRQAMVDYRVLLEELLGTDLMGAPARRQERAA